MKKSLNTSFALFSMVLIFWISAVFASAETEGIFTYEVQNNKATLVSIASTARGSVEIPSSLGGYTVTKIGTPGRDATSSALDELIIPDTVESVLSTAFGYSSIGKFTVNESSQYLSTDENGVLYDKNKTVLLVYPTLNPAVHYTVADTTQKISTYSFIGANNLETIALPDSLNTIGSQVFWNCKSLKSIEISENITYIDQNTFGFCTALESVKLPDSLTTIRNGAFTECYSLKKIEIPKNVTEISMYAFENCVALERVILPLSLTKIDTGAFGRCAALKHVYYEGSSDDFGSISITNSTSSYNNDAIINAEKHYNFNSSLYVNISDEYVNDIAIITGSGATPSSETAAWHYWDEYSETATALIINGDITTIGSYSFSGFDNLSIVIINSPSVTIEPNAFTDCPNLENVIFFGDSIFTKDAFSGCSATINVFQNTKKQHSFTSSQENINVLPFTSEGNTISFSGNFETDAYSFFDVIAAFCNEFENVSHIKFNKFTSEDITFYRYDEVNYNYVPIEGNSLEKADFSVFIDSWETGRVDITFNELCSGISDGSITDFYLVAADEKHDDVLDTEIEVKDEEEESFFEKALKWIVSLINKLFKLLSRL